MRRSWIVLVVVAMMTAGCGSTQKQKPLVRLSPREIIDTSSPAIVRIEAGEAKVGTGFILDENGLIATNLHVIEGEANVRVKLYKDSTDYPVVSIAAIDKSHDLALIRIKPKKPLPKLTLGDSSAV